MNGLVTLQVSEHVLRHATSVATTSQQRVEDVLIEWLETTVAEKPVQSLSDEEVLALSEMKFTPDRTRKVQLSFRWQSGR